MIFFTIPKKFWLSMLQPFVASLEIGSFYNRKILSIQQTKKLVWTNPDKLSRIFYLSRRGFTSFFVIP